jgi:hypothetical protein
MQSLSRDQLNDFFNSFYELETNEAKSPEPEQVVVKSVNNINITIKQVERKNKTSEEVDVTFCQNCKQTNGLVSENGMYECQLCGAVESANLNMEQEWRYYGESDSKGADPNRVGMPTNSLLPESSLGSTISFKYGESY